MADNNHGRFAVVTGASSGIGLRTGQDAPQDGFDLIVAADEPVVHAARR